MSLTPRISRAATMLPLGMMLPSALRAVQSRPSIFTLPLEAALSMV